MRFNDARRLGYGPGGAGTLPTTPCSPALGPEPLEAVRRAAPAALRGRRTSIKAALLDQRIVAGLGNIYVSDKSLIAPALAAPARGSDLGRARRAARGRDQVGPAEAVAAGGSSLRDYVQTSGELGSFQHTLGGLRPRGQALPRLRLRRSAAAASDASSSPAARLSIVQGASDRVSHRLDVTGPPAPPSYSCLLLLGARWATRSWKASRTCRCAGPRQLPEAGTGFDKPPAASSSPMPAARRAEGRGRTILQEHASAARLRQGGLSARGRAADHRDSRRPEGGVTVRYTLAPI